MNEVLILIQRIDPVMPTIISISNRTLHSSTETNMKEHNDSSDCKQAHGNVLYSNTDFEPIIADLSNITDSTEKDDATAQHALVTPDRVEDKKIFRTRMNCTQGI